jgi:hypothetical protein
MCLEIDINVAEYYTYAHCVTGVYRNDSMQEMYITVYVIYMKCTYASVLVVFPRYSPIIHMLYNVTVRCVTSLKQMET